MRIIGHPTFRVGPGLPAQVAALVTRLRTLEGHVFWPDDVSLTGAGAVDLLHIMTPGQVTDT